MTDGNEKPKLQPPPRVPAAVENGADTGSSSGPERANPPRRFVRAAVLIVLVLGLIGVFVLLPRWQERREERLVTGRDAREAAPATAVPEAVIQGPEPAAVEEISEPSPVPAPTRASRPAPTESRITPRHQPSSDQRQYVDAMSEGLAALEARQWQVALAAFERASRLRPGASEVADGVARARAGQRRETVAESLRRAGELERGEEWRQAEKRYAAVLGIDPESAAALAGRLRTEVRASLDEKLEFHLANPGRLSTPAVFDDAGACLEEALETVPSGPRLESQIARLEAALERASAPVSVVLESDAMTEIVVYRVGRLGTFTRRELALRPGTYTVVGSRAGYRDVRLQLVVTPGSPAKPLVVQCAERL
jgi:tetratricopeptide (TPR) repeat protein